MDAQVTKINGRYVWVNNKKYINLSTTAYLNLSYEKEFQQWLKEGIDRYGFSYGSSPLTRPRFDIYRKLEQFLAEYYGFEQAILFSNGFAAAQAVVKAYKNMSYHVKYGEVHHPALDVESKGSGKAVVAMDLVDPINSSITDYKAYNGHELIIDASHAFGVIDDLIKNNNNHIVCGSLNKGFSVPAGLVLCSSAQKDLLIKQPLYSTSSAPSPAVCYALYMAFKQGFISLQQEKLNRLIHLVFTSDKYFKGENLPVIKINNNAPYLPDEFLKEGYLLWHNQYPMGASILTTRAIIHAGLKDNDVRRCLELIERLS